MNEAALGALRGTFRMSDKDNRQVQIVQIGCGGLGIILLIGAIISFFVARELGWYIILGGAAVLAFASVAWMTFAQRRRDQRIVEVYENGVGITGGGGKRRILIWDEIVDVGPKSIRMRHDGRSFTPTDLNDSMGILRHYWSLQPRGEDAITFEPDQWENSGQMFQSIEEGIRTDRLPDMQETLKKGESVMFGDRYGLSRTGLFKEGKLIPWSTVGGMHLGERSGLSQLAAYYDGKWRHYAYVTSIPNSWLFLELLDELGVPMK